MTITKLHYYLSFFFPQPCRTHVPRWSNPQIVEERELCWSHWRRSSGLPWCRHRVSRCRSPWTGWKCRSRQQEVQDHPEAPSAGHPQWWGVEQASCRSHHRSGRCPSKYPGNSLAEENWQSRESLTYFPDDNDGCSLSLKVYRCWVINNMFPYNWNILFLTKCCFHSFCKIYNLGGQCLLKHLQRVLLQPISSFKGTFRLE